MGDCQPIHLSNLDKLHHHLHPVDPLHPHHVNPHLLSQLQQPTLTGIIEPKVTALSQFKLTCYDKSQPKLIQAPVFL